MSKVQAINDNKAGIVDKIHALDFMMESLGKIHEENKEAVDEFHKKISTRKLLLMEELFKLLSHLSM
jgi:hypothetical protein